MNYSRVPNDDSALLKIKVLFGEKKYEIELEPSSSVLDLKTAVVNISENALTIEKQRLIKNGRELKPDCDKLNKYTNSNDNSMIIHCFPRPDTAAIAVLRDNNKQVKRSPGLSPELVAPCHLVAY